MLRLGKFFGWYRPTFSTGTHIAVLGTLVVAPLVVVQGYFSWELARRERADLQDLARRQAVSISAVIDRELRSAETSLHALATSTKLDDRDYEGFIERAKLVTADFPGSTIGIRNPDSQILASTAGPVSGLTVQVSDVLRAADQKALSQQQTVTTDLYSGAVTNRTFVNVQVPIIKADAKYVLSFSFDSTYMSRLIASADIHHTWLVTLVDRNGRIVSTNQTPEAMVGKPSVTDISHFVGDSGTLPPAATRGEVFTAYARSKLSGWIVDIDVPIATIEEPLRRTYWTVGITILCGIGLATLFGALYARHLTRSLNRLARVAVEGSRGQDVTPVSTLVSEVRDVSLALTHAFGTLKQNDETQRLLIRELHHRFKNTLAMISGIARASGRNATDMKSYIDVLTARLSALARAHDVMIRRDEASGDIRDVILNASEPFCEADRLSLKGPHHAIDSQKVVWLGMILHELFTNALKYGALSTPGGLIEIDWDLQETSPTGQLTLKWHERDVLTPGGQPNTKGFGSTLIDSVLTQWGGGVRRDFSDGGLTVTLDVPA